MKKQTLQKSILCLLMALVCNVAWAAVTLPMVSTSTEMHFYRIKNFRSNKYAAYTGDNQKLAQTTDLTPSTIWYVTADGGNYKLHNVATDMIYAGVSSFTANGATVYIKENPYKAGYVCVSTTENLSSNCWDDQGNRTNIGNYNPRSGDADGTSWSFEEVTEGVGLYNYTLNEPTTGTTYNGTYICYTYNDEKSLPRSTTNAGAKLTDCVWDENILTANIAFPFPVSSEEKPQAVVISAYNGTKNPGEIRYYVDGTNVKAYPSTTVTENKDKWEIYPTLADGKFTFIIKNVGTGKYIQTSATSASHNAGTVTVVEGKENATSFTWVTGNRFRLPTDTELYLSAGSSGTSNQNIGVFGYNSNNGGPHYGISNFVYKSELPYVLTDIAGNEYTGSIDATQTNLSSWLPTFSGCDNISISDKQLAEDGTKLTATIAFPFPVSKEGGVTNVTMIANGASWGNPNSRKWRAVKDNSVDYVKVQTSATNLVDASQWLWAIYPELNNGAFSFKIKNIATGKYVYANPEATGETNDVKGTNKPVTLSDTGTAFSYKNRIGSNYHFEYTNTAGTTLRPSMNGSGDTDVFLGVYKGGHNGNDVCFPDPMENTTFPFPVSTAETTKVTLISSFNASGYTSENFKWQAEGTNILVKKGDTPSLQNLNQYYWAIYPTLDERGFTFVIKNIGTGEYIYSTSNKDSHDSGIVTLADKGSDLTFEANNRFKLPTNKYLSAGSSSASDQYIGTWSDHKGCYLKFFDLGTYTVTIPTSGYTAIYTPFAVTIPDGVTAYTGKLNANNTILSLDTISTAIPANTAVIISGAASTTYTFSKHGDEVAAIEGNNLQGAETSVEVTNIEGNVYTLQYSDGTASFAKVAEGSIPGYTAYIAVESEGEAILIKEFEKALITANQAKLGEGIGYASYTVNGNKVYTADAVIAAIDAATSADDINAIKESFKYEIPMAGVPYALYDAVHNVYLDIHNLGKEKNDVSQDKLATLGTSVQPLYITGDTNNGTWKIHTAPEGEYYLHQAGGARNWNSWVSNEPGDFSWGVEVSTSEGEITYKLKKLTGGYLGTDVSLHKDGEPLYVNAEAARALNLKLVTLPVLAVNNLDAQGITYPYALTDEQASKVFGQDDITIAIDVTTATMNGRQALICAADPTLAITGATKNNSPYVAYGFYGSNPAYLPSSAAGDRFTYQAFSATASANYKVVYVVDQTNKKFSIYIDGVLKSTADYPVVSYELQSFDNFSTTDGDKLYIGGGIVNNTTAHDKFGGTIHSVKVYNYALTAEEIATIEYPATDKQESDALKALIAETQELVNSCYGHYVTEAALQTTNAEEGYYVSTNAQEDAEGPIANLVDGNYSNHFHSEYTTDKGGNHYININLGNDNATKSFKFKYATRKTGTNFPKTIEISGSNDGETFTPIATVTDLPVGNQTTNIFYTSDIIESETAYTQLRFTVTANNSGNKEAGGNPFFHMAEFDLMLRSEEAEIIYPNSTILLPALETAKVAITTAQEEADKIQTATEYAAATEALQAAYDELAAAVANGNRPILISLDSNKPYIYKIGSKRGNTKVLQPANYENKLMVAVVDYDDTNMEQAWYFTKGSDDEKVFIHPYMAGGNVLSASSTNNNPNAVWAAEKGTVTHQEWIVAVVDQANGTYNIKAGDGSNYFSNNGGTGNKMGFWNDKPTTDGGSLFTFTHVELKDILEAYKDTHCTKESYAVGEALGYYQGGATYNEARVAVVEVLADEEATAEDYKNAYIALRDAKGALKLLTPEAGKFYRIKSVAGWNDDAPYLGAANSTAKDGRAEFVETADANTIFYFDGNNLLSYGSGLYLVSNSYFLGYNGIQSIGTKIAFHEASNNLAGTGAFNISFNDGGRWLYCHTDNYTDAGGRGIQNGYCFNIEEITELPIAISGAGYTTLFAPTTLEIPAAVEAYVVSEVQSNSVLLQKVEGVVPAETGLIIKGNTGNYTFSIGGDATAEITANELKGTVAKSLITPDANNTCYVLANGTSGVGLYKASLNKDANGTTVAENGVAFINNAYKVYLPVEKAPAQAARALTFRFGRGDDDNEGTTDIENSEIKNQKSEMIFDLSGRRVLNPTKGMYIVNGKKVVIR